MKTQAVKMPHDWSRVRTIAKDRFGTKIVLRTYTGTNQDTGKQIIHNDLYTDGELYLTPALARNLSHKLIQWAQSEVSPEGKVKQ